MPTEEETRQQIEALLVQVFDMNRTFLAKQSPTNADVLAQVRLLTRQLQAVWRERLGRLDTID